MNKKFGDPYKESEADDAESLTKGESQEIHDTVFPSGSGSMSKPVNNFKDAEALTAKLNVSPSPSPGDLTLAKVLTGSPFQVDDVEAHERLVGFGVAAHFGDEGYARGHKWRQWCK